MSEEFATVVLKELREFRTETNQKFDSLGGKVDVLQTEVTELKKLSNEHTKAINKLQEDTEEHTKAINGLQEITKEHTKAINGLQEITKEHTKAISELQEATEKMQEEIVENTNEINELKITTEENTKAIEELKIVTEENSKDIKELKTITAENSKGIKELRQGRERDKKSILGVLEAMDKSISQSFEDLKKELDVKFESLNVLQGIQQLKNTEIDRKIKLNNEKMKLFNMRIAKLEEWKDNFESGLISMV